MTPSTMPQTGSPASGGGTTQQPTFVEEMAIYPFSVTLTGNQALTRLPVNIDRDSDFVLMGIAGGQTGGYTLNLRLPSGRLIASAQMVNSQFVAPNANQPTPWGPPSIYRAGSTGPEVDITDTSGSGNTVNLLFIGTRRLRTS